MASFTPTGSHASWRSAELGRLSEVLLIVVLPYATGALFVSLGAVPFRDGRRIIYSRLRLSVPLAVEGCNAIG